MYCETYCKPPNANRKKDKSSYWADENNSIILYQIQAKCAIGITKAKVDTKLIKNSTKMC